MIALIITIIVLLILAGVSINAVVGDNGVLGQAMNAATATDVADTKEQIQVALVNYFDDSGNYSKGNVTSAVQDVLGSDASVDKNTDEDGTVTYTTTTAKGNTVDITDLIEGANNVDLISTEESYVGYYADVDGDGTVDGVIYVDLMHEQTAEYWYLDSSNFNYITYTTYSWNTITSSKDYCISEYDYEDDFGIKNVIAPFDGSVGNERFYVMALDDFTTESYSTFYWYYRAYTTSPNISDYSTVTSSDFGAGKTNTENMISCWNNKTYGSQMSRDMWGVIQDEVDEGWFVPSTGEWGAFAAELGITVDNCSKYFSSAPWSSTLYSSNMALYLHFWHRVFYQPIFMEYFCCSS